MKTKKIGLIALGAAMATLPLAVSAQSTTETAPTEQRTHHDHTSNYGLIGLLGLLGLAGLRRKKDHDRTRAPVDDRPPAPQGSYVSDLKAERRTPPE